MVFLSNLQFIVSKSLAFGLLCCCLSACSGISPAIVDLSKEETVLIKDLQRAHIASINQYFDYQELRVKEFIKNDWTPLFLKNMLGESNIISDINLASPLSVETQDNIRVVIDSYLIEESEVSAVMQKLSAQIKNDRKNEAAVVNNILKDYIDDDKLSKAQSQVMALLGSEEAGIFIMEFASDANFEINQQRETMLKPLRDKRRELLAALNSRYEELLAAQGVITGRLIAEAKSSELRDDIFQKIFKGQGVVERS